jgi:hypothetical protein
MVKLLVVGERRAKVIIWPLAVSWHGAAPTGAIWLRRSRSAGGPAHRRIHRRRLAFKWSGGLGVDLVRKRRCR